MDNPEIITLREALARVGLAGLVDGDENRYKAGYLVGWTGIPQMFSCGHDSVRGFGPLRGDYLGEGADRPGERLYQERVRVCQALCSGQILFGWQRWGKYHDQSGVYAMNSSAYVVIDTPPGELRPVIKLAISA